MVYQFLLLQCLVMHQHHHHQHQLELMLILDVLLLEWFQSYMHQHHHHHQSQSTIHQCHRWHHRHHHHQLQHTLQKLLTNLVLSQKYQKLRRYESFYHRKNLRYHQLLLRSILIRFYNGRQQYLKHPHYLGSWWLLIHHHLNQCFQLHL